MPFDTLLDYSGVLAEKREMLMADRIDGVLKEYGFVYMGKDPNTKEVVEIPIEIDSPRLVCMDRVPNVGVRSRFPGRRKQEAVIA